MGREQPRRRVSGPDANDSIGNLDDAPHMRDVVNPNDVCTSGNCQRKRSRRAKGTLLNWLACDLANK